jgi:hypothetical protein
MAMKGDPSHRLRGESRWIASLQTIPRFREIVKRLLDGESSRRLAQWVYELPEKGRLQHARPETIRKYLIALRLRLNDRPNEQVRVNMQLLAEAEGIESEVRVEVLPPEGERQEQAVVELTSQAVLSYALQRAKRRIDLIDDIETRTGMPMWPPLNRDLGVVVSIGEILQKRELTEKLLISRGPREAPLLSPLGERVQQLSDVDKHLIRDYGLKLLTLLRKKAAGNGSAATTDG